MYNICGWGGKNRNKFREFFDGAADGNLKKISFCIFCLSKKSQTETIGINKYSQKDAMSLVATHTRHYRVGRTLLLSFFFGSCCWLMCGWWLCVNAYNNRREEKNNNNNDGCCCIMRRTTRENDTREPKKRNNSALARHHHHHLWLDALHSDFKRGRKEDGRACRVCFAVPNAGNWRRAFYHIPARRAAAHFFFFFFLRPFGRHHQEYQTTTPENDIHSCTPLL